VPTPVSAAVAVATTFMLLMPMMPANLVRRGFAVTLYDAAPGRATQVARRGAGGGDLEDAWLLDRAVLVA